VMVRIKQKPDSLTLEIKDNGKGFDQKQKLKGIGLVNIFQRAEAYNGKTSIETSPGNGCKVYVDFALGVPPQDTAIKQN
ncbi:MAG: ATP-binding protein, partial [Bacteroidota bacterium]